MTRKLHRYLGIGLGLFWLIQIVTGLAIQYRYEIDDRLLGARPAHVDGAMIDRADVAIAQTGQAIDSIWISGGVEGQLDIYTSDGSRTFTARVGPEGRLLRLRDDAIRIGQGAGWDFLKDVHQKLLGGTTGQAIVGLSGLFLLATIAMGSMAGWRRRAQWRSMTARPASPARGQAARRAWHRLIGFWLALPLGVIVASGVLLAWQPQYESVLSSGKAALAAPPAQGTPISPGAAVDTALAVFPGSTFTAINYPSSDSAMYVVRVHAPGEILRKYGASKVYVGNDGSVFAAKHSGNAAPGDAFLGALYPVHTGQIAGWPGRLLAFLAGLGALVLIGLAAWALIPRGKCLVRPLTSRA